MIERSIHIKTPTNLLRKNLDQILTNQKALFTKTEIALMRADDLVILTSIQIIIETKYLRQQK